MNLKVIEQLGAGGFGTVELVVDESGNQYARKTFSLHQPLSASLEQNVKKRFIREAKIQQSLKHKNIVPVLGAELNEKAPYYLMPVGLGTLADDMSKDRTLSNKFLSAISDIVAGLEELHRLDIFHRDLKPQNVLRLNDGADDYYAISDFGLISQKDSTLSKLTTTGMAKGSDYFTAPEVTADLKNATRQSDIFSLGCILHEMVGQKDRVPCQEIREDGDYGAILLGCTRNDPKRRFKSVGSVLDALVSINPNAPILNSHHAATYAAAIESAGPLTEARWKEIVDFLEDNVGSTDAKALLMKLSLSRIDEVCKTFSEQAAKLGIVYAEWVASSGFNFDACDGIANRLHLFIEACPLTAKVEGLMAMLQMGTSHNRYFVEHKFLDLCGPGMDETAAKRLAIEFRTAEDSVCKSIAHLEKSIGVQRTMLHPLLVKTLSEICQ